MPAVTRWIASVALVSSLAGACAGGTPPPTAPRPEPPPPRDTSRDARAAYVAQRVHPHPITMLLADATWPHFVTVGGGVVAVSDARTGVVRASRRPWPREEVRVHTSRDGRVLVLEPMSSYVREHLVWSLDDDRVVATAARGASSEQVRISPDGTRVLVTRAVEGGYALEVIDRARGEILAERDFPDAPRLDLTPNGDVVVMARTVTSSVRVFVLDPATLVTRHAFDDAIGAPSALGRSDRVLVPTREGLALRATDSGETLGALATEGHVSLAGEGADGQCLALQVSSTSRVLLVRADDLGLVATIDLAAHPGSYAVAPRCEGLVVQTSAGERFAFGPAHPPEGTPLGAPLVFSNLFGTGPRVTPIVQLDDTTLLLANGVARARLDRATGAPTFVMTPTRADAPAVVDALDFLPSGAALVTTRARVLVVDAEGVRASPCAPGEVMRAPSGRVYVRGEAGLCAVEDGARIDARIAAPPRAYPFVAEGASGRVRVDLDGETTPLPEVRGGTIVAIGPDGRYAHVDARGARVTIEGGETRRTRVALAHPGTRFVLHEDGLSVESEGFVASYDLRGELRFERAVTRDAFVRSAPDRPFWMVGRGARVDVIDPASGRVLGSFPGAPLDPEPPAFLARPRPLELPVIAHEGRASFVVVRDGVARAIALGDARVVSAPGAGSSDRLAICRAGVLEIVEATGTRRAFGDCHASDRVAVRADGAALLMTRGAELIVRTAESDVVLHILETGDALTWLASSGERFVGSADAADVFRFRPAGPMLETELVALDPVRAAEALLGVLAR